MNIGPSYVLTFDSAAWARCFLVADVLAEEYHEHMLEYGLIGLARQREPFHLIDTRLLPGQSVTCASVRQPGHDVLRLRREIRSLAQTRGEALIPICFIHRHPGACDISGTDETFLLEVFLPQVSTALPLKTVRCIPPGYFGCDCLGPRTARAQGSRQSVQLGVAFSVIVNAAREFAAYGAEKEWCPRCGRSRVRMVPVGINLAPQSALLKHERRQLKQELARGVAERITLPLRASSRGGVV